MPGNLKDKLHKDDVFSVSRKVKGIIKFLKYDTKHDRTELRIAVR